MSIGLKTSAFENGATIPPLHQRRWEGRRGTADPPHPPAARADARHLLGHPGFRAARPVVLLYRQPEPRQPPRHLQSLCRASGVRFAAVADRR